MDLFSVVRVFFGLMPTGGDDVRRQLQGSTLLISYRKEGVGDVALVGVICGRWKPGNDQNPHGRFPHAKSGLVISRWELCLI